MAYAKECAAAGMELVPYDGDNPYKLGTAVCAGCGVRCSRDTGLPTEGNVCSMIAGNDQQSVESQRKAIEASMQERIDARAKELLAERQADHDAEVEDLKRQLVEAKASAKAVPNPTGANPTAGAADTSAKPEEKNTAANTSGSGNVAADKANTPPKQ